MTKSPKMPTASLLAVAALALAAVPAAAQVAGANAGQPDLRERAAETTRAQAEARAAAMFDRIDTNRDGVIDEAERAAAREAAQARMAERGAARRAQMEQRRTKMGERRAKMAEGRQAEAPTTRDAAIARALERFDRMDANKDGVVTADERRAARAARMGGRRAGQPAPAE